MGSFYLSKHNNKKDNSIRLYAVSQVWDPEKGRQKKDKQIYLGCKRADGTCNFNSKAETYLYLLQGTEFERPFYHWQDYKKEQQAFATQETTDETTDEQALTQQDKEEKQTVVLKLSPATIKKAKLLEKKSPDILSRLLEMAVKDSEMVKKCL